MRRLLAVVIVAVVSWNLWCPFYEVLFAERQIQGHPGHVLMYDLERFPDEVQNLQPWEASVYWGAAGLTWMLSEAARDARQIPGRWKRHRLLDLLVWRTKSR